MKCKAVRCIYYNAGNGYTVASYVTEETLPKEVSSQKNGRYGMFMAIGNELPTEDGLEVELNGTWKDGKFGMQYKVSSFQIALPTSTEGIKAYLASDLIKGIGPVLAERIVDRYQENTFEVLEKNPEKLLEIKGITRKKLSEILEGYRGSETLRQLMVTLSPFGVTPRKVAQIQEHFGNAAPLIIQNTPFRLCEIPGFGFLTVDPIAVKAKNFKPDEPMRIKAAILHIMSEAEGEGHLYLTCEEILKRTALLLNHKKETGLVPERAIRDAGNEMIRKDGTLVCSDGGFYLKNSFRAELGAAASLVKLILRGGTQSYQVDSIISSIQKKEKILLNARQKEGILRAFQYPVTIITGGPGRGKTTDMANGDVGEVLNIYKADGKSRMRVDFGDGKIMEYTEGDIWPLNLAYCITVHKAQGSEYPVVILPMLTCFYRMLRKNLFYTAVTRARRGVKIVGSKKAMVIAINNDTVSKRNTMFGYRIKKIYKAYLEQEKKSA